MNSFAADWQILETRGWLATRCAPIRPKLAGIARWRRFVRREPILLAGDTPDGVLGIASGSVHLSLPRSDGLDFIAGRLGVGSWICTPAVFASLPSELSVWAAEETRAFHLPGCELSRLLRECPALHEDFYALIHDNYGLALRMLSGFSEESVDRRVARRLAMEFDGRACADGWIALSQPELAEMLAVSLPTVQRCLRRLVSQGLVRIGYSRLQVVDRRALEHSGSAQCDLV